MRNCIVIAESGWNDWFHNCIATTQREQRVNDINFENINTYDAAYFEGNVALRQSDFFWILSV